MVLPKQARSKVGGEQEGARDLGVGRERKTANSLLSKGSLHGTGNAKEGKGKEKTQKWTLRTFSTPPRFCYYSSHKL